MALHRLVGRRVFAITPHSLICPFFWSPRKNQKVT